MQYIYHRQKEPETPRLAWDNIFYFTSVWLLGIGLLGTLIYAMDNLEEKKSVTWHMTQHPEYRMTLSTLVIFHCLVWAFCVYKKNSPDNCLHLTPILILCSIILTWIGLVIFLSDFIHFVFVTAFLIFTISLLLTLSFSTQDTTAKNTLRIGVLGLFIGGILMYVLESKEEFYIPEYTALMFYSIIFTVYFTLHPYYNWESDMELLSQQELKSIKFTHGTGDSSNFYSVTDDSDSSQVTPLLVTHQSNRTPRGILTVYNLNRC
jgi:FtsH-binding integral membrane protein